MSKSKDEEKWEEAICPICMEHPHNAILLICSSHDRGCRPFMCDTSYPHSKCLDQFRDSTSRRLICPLCRGSVSGWTVIESARKLMNAKSRSCGCCELTGTYSELCEHATSTHPLELKHPLTKADLQRHRRTLERLRANIDRLRIIRPSALPEVRLRLIRRNAAAVQCVLQYLETQCINL